MDESSITSSYLKLIADHTVKCRVNDLTGRVIVELMTTCLDALVNRYYETFGLGDQHELVQCIRVVENVLGVQDSEKFEPWDEVLRTCQ